MNIRGHVNRTLTVHGIPSGRICRTEKLNFQPEAGLGFFNGHILNLFGCQPGGAAGSTSVHFDLLDLLLFNLYIDFRGSKKISILSQTILVCKGASGRGADSASRGNFFSGGDHRNVQAFAHQAQVL